MMWNSKRLALSLLLGLPALTSAPAEDPAGQMKQSTYIRDAKTWTTPFVRPAKGFEFEVEISSLGKSYKAETVRRTIDALELGTYQRLRGPSSAYEWDYSFTHLNGRKDGIGRIIQAGYPESPASRADALTVIEAFLLRQYLNGGDSPRPWVSKNGHYMWHHYAGEFGFDVLASEVGENINSYQMHVAFNRGAAKQYRKPWAIDFSAWHGPSITDYSTGKIWGNYSGPDHGHSMSLLRRTYFMSYMSGASYIIAEAGGAISFYDRVDEKGHYVLSPYGEVGKEFYDFTRKHPDLGIAYTPFAIVLDFYHGVYSGFGKKLAFHHFPYDDGDEMTWKLLDLFFPGGWSGKGEAGALVNGPYGDTCDVLLQNAPQPLLNSYPVLILSGDIQFSAEEVDRYKAYVRQGGTLILNEAYMKSFPEYQDVREDGQGNVIVYGPAYRVDALDAIIREQLAEHMPFALSEPIQHIVSVKDGHLYLTLINSDGVTKGPRTPPVVDPTKQKTVTVRYIGKLEIRRLTELLTGRALAYEGNRLAVTIDPGDLVVLEFAF